jgi:hypothetical protein
VAAWDFTQMVPAHFAGPVAATPAEFRRAFTFLEKAPQVCVLSPRVRTTERREREREGLVGSRGRWTRPWPSNPPPKCDLNSLNTILSRAAHYDTAGRVDKPATVSARVCTERDAYRQRRSRRRVGWGSLAREIFLHGLSSHPSEIPCWIVLQRAPPASWLQRVLARLRGATEVRVNPTQV